MNSKTICPVCESTDNHIFFEQSNVPINVCVQWPSRKQAVECPLGDIGLTFCRSCGFIWNTLFNFALVNYTQNYENSLFFSPLFREYSESMARLLIDRYSLRNKTVIDIGCGKGDFLSLFCGLGNNRGVGFDTSFVNLAKNSEVSERMTIIRDFYSEKYSSYKADLFCNRYVLEHVDDPGGFLATIRAAVADQPGAVVYSEVPNSWPMLRDSSVWDIIYEHKSYFTLTTLERLFNLHNFEVVKSYETYCGLSLGIEVVPAPVKDKVCNMTPTTVPDSLMDMVGSFAERVQNRLEGWREKLKDMVKAQKRTVFWGAGARVVSFLNMLNISDDVIPYVVDVNPRKQGRYVPGTGQLIVPPAFLKEFRPDFIALINKIYQKEIELMLKDIGVTAEFA